MLKFIIIFIIIFLMYLKFTLKLSIDLKSFIRKGFKKIDNQFGCFCYCGKQGRGKTYSATRFTINRKITSNATIITNVSSFCLFDDTIFIPNIDDLIDYVINYSDSLSFDEQPNIIIFFDEIFTILSKNSKNMNEKILSFLSQLRKRKIVFVTTAQEWREIDVTFRRYVRFQIDCKMISTPLTNTAILFNKIYDGEQLHWDNLENDYIAPILQTNIAKGNQFIINSYDTFETITIDKTPKGLSYYLQKYPLSLLSDNEEYYID